MNPVIRARLDTDLDACVEALRAVFAVDSYPTAWPSNPARWLTPSDLWQAWVAVDGASIVGHMVLSSSADAVAVNRLFVVPDARGRGLAATLLATARDAAQDQRLDLEVADHNRDAVRLYERTGWRRLDSYRADWLAPDGKPALVHRYTLPST